MAEVTETVVVTTAYQIYAWTETHDHVRAGPWLPEIALCADAARLVVAVPVWAPDGRPGFAAFLALTPADAARLRRSVF